MKIDTNKDKIEELLTRGVEKIYPSDDFLREQLKSGKQLTIYLGVDPTGPTLHVGHLIPLLKLRAFQKLGHRVIFLIGDFTARIGDPTDKTATRVSLSEEQVTENARLYKEQASHFIDFDGENPASIKYNSDWLAKMSFTDTMSLMSQMTYAQTIKRDMFQKRIAEEKDLYLHEFLYPLLQGYDSVAMEVDGEVGGNDQTFNMLAGRDLLKKMKGKEKFVIGMKLLEDSSGFKMGKTTGNMVAFTDTPEEMFGKIMSWNDNRILLGMELCTDMPWNEVLQIRQENINGLSDPREYKMVLAKEIVGLYYGKDSAKKAQGEFIKVFQKKGVPDNIETVTVPSGAEISSILLENKLVKSKSDFRRLLDEGAISLDDNTITNPQETVRNGGVVRVGKKRFLKVVVQD